MKPPSEAMVDPHKTSLHNKAIIPPTMNHIHEEVGDMQVHQISEQVDNPPDESSYCIESGTSTMYHDEEAPPSRIQTDQEQDDDDQGHQEQDLQMYSNRRQRYAGHLLIILLFWCGQKYVIPPFCNLVDMLDGIYLDRNDDLFSSLDER
ncbi:hypothetical protein ACHAWO_002185 [Cyclotella atomus]|uniref:Uncharacterized protein n=1 Tax=Cyclotella atomus TaxID=382360 RepID=A0ABD3NVV1_9STRA